MRDERASATAVIVCQGRAAAHGRLAQGRFADETAMALLREDERDPVCWVREAAAPRGWRDQTRYGLVRATAEVMVPRTVAIDDAVRERLAPQLVILGAGLDGRAWRMPELADTHVFEVDHPATQADKRDRLAGLPQPVREPTFVPVDLARERLDGVLAAAGHRPTEATTWIWEGVVPYLTRDEVRATLDAISELSAPGSRLVVSYQSPALAATLGQHLARLAMAIGRQRSYWADEPRRSSWRPAAMAELLADHGFAVNHDDDLLSLAERLPMPVRQRGSLRSGRVAVADR